MLPWYEEEDSEEVCLAKITASAPHSLISEFYRKMKTNLFFSAAPGELKTFLITGSSAGCGKTTVAVNLGITLAMEGKRVLLIDANFRRPAIAELFPGGSSHGLCEILQGEASGSEVIRSSEIKGLDLVNSGSLPPNPADLLNSGRMRDFLEQQRRDYDYVIIDAAPSLVVVDARILASQVDGTIPVVHAEDTSRGEARRMISELKSGNNVNLVGVLLNGVQARKGGYFEKAYRSYYEYISTST